MVAWAQRIGAARRLAMPRSLFEVGALVEIEVNEPFVGRAYQGRVVAVDAETVTVSAAQADGRPIDIVAGTRVILSMPRRLTHYSFDTEVVDARWHPQPLLVLSRPEDEQAAANRSDVRIDVIIPNVRLFVPSARKATSWATILDLSAGGALLRTSFPLPLGASLWLEFVLPEGWGTIVTGACALHGRERRRGQEPPSYRTSLRFVGISDGDRQRIRRFIFNRERVVAGRWAV